MPEDPILPEQAAYAWSYFLSLNRQRPSGGMGFSCIPFSEIMAFCVLTNTYIEPWELELILAWDSIAMQHFAEEQEKQTKSANKSK